MYVRTYIYTHIYIRTYTYTNVTNTGSNHVTNWISSTSRTECVPSASSKSESCHTCKWDMLHIEMSHVKHRVMSRTESCNELSHVSHSVINELSHNAWVMSRTESAPSTSSKSKSGYSCEWDMSRTESCHELIRRPLHHPIPITSHSEWDLPNKWIMPRTEYKVMTWVTNESCHNEWVMSSSDLCHELSNVTNWVLSRPELWMSQDTMNEPRHELCHVTN